MTTRRGRSWNGERLLDGFLRCLEQGVKKQEPTVTWLLLQHAGYGLQQPWLSRRPMCRDVHKGAFAIPLCRGQAV